MRTLDSTRVFSARAGGYAKYRPTYPTAIIELLTAACGLTPAALVVDVGSGTGSFTKLLLHHGNSVIAVEPNPEMRRAAEGQFAADSRFLSLAATAEALPLADHSIAFVTAAQAFHWFEPTVTRREFARVLMPGGWVVLVWHVRRTIGTPFLEAFEACWQRYAANPRAVQQPVDYARLVEPFFGGGAWQQQRFETIQWFDLDGLCGRVLSASLAPDVDHPNFAPLLVELSDLFRAYQVDGLVGYEYDTWVYYGHLQAAGC